MAAFVSKSNSLHYSVNEAQQNSTVKEDEIEKTLKLLEDGEKEIELNEQHRNVTLVLGITGSGKSSFVQWFAGDASKLISVEKEDDEDEYIIKDESRISNSTTESKTIFPELVVDLKTNNAFYDCPGFVDTRNASIDIAGTYFVKKVTDFAQNIRMLLLVDHPSVEGVSRSGLTSLLKHSTDLVKNVDKYSTSIALVATKVKNFSSGGKFKTTEKIINSIGSFLLKVKSELIEKGDPNDANAIKLLDVLLHQNSNQTYSRIGIFRKPNKAGPLSEIPLMVEGKKDIDNMVETLEFTSIDHDRDFGYAISDSSKNYINGLVNQINGRMWQDADTIARGIAQYYQQFTNPIIAKINTFVTATESVDANLVEAQALANKLKAAARELLVPNVTSKILVDKFNYILNAFEIDNLRDNVERISFQTNHLEFLQTFSQSTLDTNHWESLLKGLADSLSNTNKVIQQEIKISSGKLANSVNSTINAIAGDLWNAKLSQMQSMNIQKLPALLDHEITAVKNQTETPNNLEQFATKISKNVETLGVENAFIKGNILKLVNYAKYMRYLQAISEQQMEIWSPEWISPLVPTVKLLNDSLEWYRFLNGLYSKFGEYQFQQDPSRFNVANLDDWGKEQVKNLDIQIGEQNFNQFLSITSQYNISGHDAIKSIQVTQWQLNELNQMLRLTLKHGKSRSDCSEKGKIRVTGDYVKFSDLKTKLVEMCQGSVTDVNIFSSNKVFIDADLDGLGDMLKITIMAPNWEVIGNRQIKLDGLPAIRHNAAKANSGKNPGNNGEDGKPGFPGGSGGHFLGFGGSFVNEQALTVTANGAIGGAAQDGGDGQASVDGQDYTAIPTSCEKGARGSYDGEDEPTWVDYHWWHHYYFLLEGTKAQNGGSGGDGGAGGLGGVSGQLELYNTNKTENYLLNLATKVCGSGKNGAGGLGKEGGKNGNDIRIYCRTDDNEAFESYYNPQYATGLEFVSYRVIKYPKANSGKDGVTGANRANIEQPKSVDTIDYAIKVTEYKQYLSDSSKDGFDRFKRHSIRSFVDKLVDNKKVNELCVDDFLNYLQKSIDKIRRQQQHSEYEIAPQQLANYSTANSNSSEFSKINAFDAQLLSVANERNTIGSNFALQQYDAVVVALKQLVFPYAHFYLDEGGFSRNNADVEYVVDSVVESLDKIRSRVIRNRGSIWQVDQYVYRAIFDSFHSSTSPFYVWSNGENRNAIRQLLSGESVVLNADIRLSDPNKDAIKFSLVEIKLKAKNSTTQAEIDTELDKFMITATHMGNSHYRYGDKYYRINSAPVDIVYTFEKDINGNPIKSNAVYRKIVSGDLILSPYAKWQIKLDKMYEFVAFDRLAKYRDAVDLELVGHGIYSKSERARSDDLQVERYYSEYIDTAQSNVTESQQLTSAKVMKVSNSLHRSSDRVPTQAINSTGALSYISPLGETVSNLFGNSNSTVNTHHIAYPRFDYTQQHNDTNNSNLTASSNSVDVNGNLLMGQLLVGLIAGKNNTITNESYISPEQTRAVQVESLAQRIAPALSQSNGTRSSQLYNSNNQWHRDLMSENVTSREHN